MVHIHSPTLHAVGIDISDWVPANIVFKCFMKWLIIHILSYLIKKYSQTAGRVSLTRNQVRISFCFPEKVYTPSYLWGYTRSISLCEFIHSLQNIVCILRSLNPEQPRIKHKGNIVSCYFVLKWYICLSTEVLQDKPAAFSCSCWRNMTIIIWLLVLIVYIVQWKKEKCFLDLSIFITQWLWLAC